MYYFILCMIQSIHLGMDFNAVEEIKRYSLGYKTVEDKNKLQSYSIANIFSDNKVWGLFLTKYYFNV